jgi:hypothetical protein
MTDTGSGAGRLPLSALLSQALVAFIIELDNEFERQMPHRTSDHGRTQGQRTVPWLVSMAMWSTCLRFVGDGGITVGELTGRARTKTNLAGMQRWGIHHGRPGPGRRPAQTAAFRLGHPRHRQRPPGTEDMAAAGRRGSAAKPSPRCGRRWSDW